MGNSFPSIVEDNNPWLPESWENQSTCIESFNGQINVAGRWLCHAYTYMRACIDTDDRFCEGMNQTLVRREWDT